MLIEKIGFYREKADEFLTKADQSSDEEGRIAYRHMAANWLLMAELAEKRAGKAASLVPSTLVEDEEQLTADM